MSEPIEVHIEIHGETHRVGLCRYIAKRRGQSTLFQYADSWLLVNWLWIGRDADQGSCIDPESSTSRILQRHFYRARIVAPSISEGIVFKRLILRLVSRQCQWISKSAAETTLQHTT